MSSPAISLIVSHYWQVNPGSILKEGQFPMSRESDSSLLSRSPVQCWKITVKPHPRLRFKAWWNLGESCVVFLCEACYEFWISPCCIQGLKTNPLKALKANSLASASHMWQCHIRDVEVRWTPSLYSAGLSNFWFSWCKRPQILGAYYLWQRRDDRDGEWEEAFGSDECGREIDYWRAGAETETNG